MSLLPFDHLLPAKFVKFSPDELAIRKALRKAQKFISWASDKVNKLNHVTMSFPELSENQLDEVDRIFWKNGYSFFIEPGTENKTVKISW